ncbi:GTP cyclohydrolase I FolE2, partial [Bacillus vallismortis]|nr:GTP cyclohydrolase I FolE2 [Bacillus vallismortis]
MAADLFDLEWVTAFEIECRNVESILLHDAYAKLRFSKQEDRI